jgi:uncharacterized protein (TIGR02284 family)
MDFPSPRFRLPDLLGPMRHKGARHGVLPNMGKIASLSELVQILVDGIAFYEQAAEKVRDQRLVDFFLRMGYLKKAIAADLEAELAYDGESATDGESLRGRLRQTYAEVLAALSDDTAQRYIDQLEQHEDHLLAAFRAASADEAPERVRELARLYYPEVNKMHLEMRLLKEGYPC